MNVLFLMAPDHTSGRARDPHTIVIVHYNKRANFGQAEPWSINGSLSIRDCIWAGDLCGLYEEAQIEGEEYVRSQILTKALNTGCIS